MKLLVFLVCIFVTSSALSFETAHINVKVGDASITINSPRSFHEISELSPTVRTYIENMVPNTNRLLGAFLSEDDVAKILSGKDPEFDSYMMVQTPRAYQDKKITRKNFSKIADLLRKQHEMLLNKSITDKTFDEIAENFKSKYDVSVDLKIDNQVALGVFLEESGAIAMTYLVAINGLVEGEKVNDLTIFNMAAANVSNKILYLYLYSDYEGKGSIDRTREIAKDWVGEVLDQ